MNVFPKSVTTKPSSEFDSEMFQNAKITDVRRDKDQDLFSVRTQINTNDPVVFNHIPREKVVHFLKKEKKLSTYLDILLDHNLHSYIESGFHIMEFYKAVQGFNVLMALEDQGNITRKNLTNVPYEELCRITKVDSEEELLNNPHYLTLTRFMSENPGCEVQAYEKSQGRYFVHVSGRECERAFGEVSPPELANALHTEHAYLKDSMNPHVIENDRSKGDISAGEKMEHKIKAMASGSHKATVEE